MDAEGKRKPRVIDHALKAQIINLAKGHFDFPVDKFAEALQKLIGHHCALDPADVNFESQRHWVVATFLSVVELTPERLEKFFSDLMCGPQGTCNRAILNQMLMAIRLAQVLENGQPILIYAEPDPDGPLPVIKKSTRAMCFLVNEDSK
jgi:hypothetical protein